jgi:hypothetical protein
MRLVDLNPQWVGYGGEGITQDGQPVPRREKVGVEFDCPCGAGGEYHRCYVQIANPPDGQGPLDDNSKWTMSGDSFENLTLIPSIQRMDGCRWHGFVTNGVIVPA